jgi:hypothetical protein
MNPANRRRFLQTSTLAAGGWVFSRNPAFAQAPAPPFAPDAPWVSSLKWQQVVDLSAVEGGGKYWDARLKKAQAMLEVKGGGVVLFPAGDYPFEDFIRLGDGIILRGAGPGEGKNAPSSKIVFPKYVPMSKGEGTPIETAFKGIVLDEPATASNCGVVDLAIDRGHIHLDEAEGYHCGANRIVYGCEITNAAVADPYSPGSKKVKQHAWQRFTARHHAAIDVKSAENVLIAHNRLPKSGEDNFTMRGYILEGRKGEEVRFDVVFDYDNRPGLYINHYCIGGAGGSGEDGTPESHPYGFRKGVIIRDNVIHNSGRMGIGFAGDGTVCSHNTIRFEKDVFRPTATGIQATFGSSTNDNRAIEARGWRWVIDGNDFEVDRNICSDGSYRINDGEGIMHEDHCNSDLRDSRLTNNKGNSYLSLYKCGTIDGLLVEGNDLSVPGDIADIYVVANRNSGPQPCRNVTTRKNLTRSNGIHMAGEPGQKNEIRDNEHIGGGGKITNEAKAKVEGNKGYAA